LQLATQSKQLWPQTPKAENNTKKGSSWHTTACST
jgi:hypothetical protein